MRYSIFALLIAGVFFFSCNQGGEESSSSTTTEENANEGTSTKTEPLSTDAVTNDATGAEDATEEPVGGNAKMDFEFTSWDFGKITQGDKVSKAFKFKNTGTEDLIISNARGSCGCTVPSYPKEPIPPGQEGEIMVEYNSKGKKGMQRKTVTITANTTPNRTVLNISSEVIVPGEGEAAADEK